MSLSLRLLLFFSVFLTIGMSLLGSVVYDSFKQSVLLNDVRVLTLFSKQLDRIIALSTHTQTINSNSLQSILKASETETIRFFLTAKTNGEFNA